MNTSYYSQSRIEMLKYIDKTQTRPLNILDVGAGQGSFIRLLQSEIVIGESWAIEPTESYRQITADQILNSTVENAIQILPEKFFDLVIFNDVLEHLQEPWDVLKAIKPKLKKDAQLIISIPNFLFIETFYKIFMGNFEYVDFGVLDRTHLRFFTKKSFIQIIESIPYKIELIEGINGYYTWKYKVLNFILLGKLSNFLHQQWAFRIKNL
jgi:2-polyprenyl-3-methyl-5-hydroxy-6-metoxy-1,4-benzoquinol methylase